MKILEIAPNPASSPSHIISGAGRVALRHRAPLAAMAFTSTDVGAQSALFIAYMSCIISENTSRDVGRQLRHRDRRANRRHLSPMLATIELARVVT